MYATANENPAQAGTHSATRSTLSYVYPSEWCSVANFWATPFAHSVTKASPKGVELYHKGTPSSDVIIKVTTLK